MAKGSNQKLKLLYLSKIFSECTDEENGLSVQEIISKLNLYEVNADRKTIYLDIEELRKFGLDIIDYHEGRNVLYKLVSREFELAELKLLVDSVQAAKFITERKSKKLITNLEKLVSQNEAKQLQRQVVLSGRIKTMNESIYYSVDKLHEAISRNRQISFQYFQWNVRKEQELRHQGSLYHISPWALVWSNENYYLIGYDSKDDKIKHYRVDKMLRLEIRKELREGAEVFRKINLPAYSNTLFGMYGGSTVDVTLLCENNMAGPIIDRFGKDIPIIPADDTHFHAHIRVSSSEQFLGWVIALGKGVRIISPDSMVDAMKEEIQRLSEQYLS